MSEVPQYARQQSNRGMRGGSPFESQQWNHIKLTSRQHLQSRVESQKVDKSATLDSQRSASTSPPSLVSCPVFEMMDLFHEILEPFPRWDSLNRLHGVTRAEGHAT